MNKQTVVYRDNGILFSDKRNELLSFEKTWRKQTHITKKKKKKTKQSLKATYCMIPKI